MSFANSVFLVGDKVKLEHVFSGLLSNAIKFSPDGAEVKITVSYVL